MKSRNGFVSNSSSSNYIIAFKQNKTPCPHCGRYDVDIEDIIMKAASGWSDTRIDDRSIDEMKDYIRECWDPEDWEGSDRQEKIKLERDEKLKLIDDIIENKPDWKILSCSVSHCDESIPELIGQMKDNSSLIIISESEG